MASSSYEHEYPCDPLPELGIAVAVVIGIIFFVTGLRFLFLAAH